MNGISICKNTLDICTYIITLKMLFFLECIANINKISLSVICCFRNVKFYFRVLGPVFEMDPLMPRTLVAALDFEKHIKDALKEIGIDAVVYLANFFYFLNVKKTVFESDFKVVYKRVIQGSIFLPLILLNETAQLKKSKNAQ